MGPPAKAAPGPSATLGPPFPHRRGPQVIPAPDTAPPVGFAAPGWSPASRRAPAAPRYTSTTPTTTTTTRRCPSTPTRPPTSAPATTATSTEVGGCGPVPPPSLPKVRIWPGAGGHSFPLGTRSDGFVVWGSDARLPARQCSRWGAACRGDSQNWGGPPPSQPGGPPRNQKGVPGGRHRPPPPQLTPLFALQLPG